MYLKSASAGTEISGSKSKIDSNLRAQDSWDESPVIRPGLLLVSAGGLGLAELVLDIALVGVG